MFGAPVRMAVLSSFVIVQKIKCPCVFIGLRGTKLCGTCVQYSFLLLLLFCGDKVDMLIDEFRNNLTALSSQPCLLA